MSHPKAAKGRSTTNAAVKKVMSTLMQFERKLDKLQDDVSFHGQALTELKTLMSKFSSAAVVKPDGKGGDEKRLSSSRKKTTTAIQYDRAYISDEPVKARRKQAILPLPLKIQPKNIAKGASSVDNSGQNRLNKASSPRTVPLKYAHNNSTRLSKAEAPRKATTLRTQKGMVKHINPIHV